MTGREIRAKLAELEEQRDDHLARAAGLVESGASMEWRAVAAANATAHATIAGVYHAQIDTLERFIQAGGA